MADISWQAAHDQIAGLIVRRQRCARSALVVGISGAQGSGKTTLSRALAEQLQARALQVAALSLDDLYLTHAERHLLAGRVHPLLATRGVPGTHDVALGVAVLTGLRALRGGEVMALPQFDKSNDDRRPESQWPCLQGPVDVLLFDGWCIGATPQPDEQLCRPINELERTCDAPRRWRRFVNDQLKHCYPRLFQLIDLYIFLRAPDFQVVPQWREQQEAQLRRCSPTGSGLLSRREVRRFVQHFQRLTEHMLSEHRADVCLHLDAQRRLRRIDGRAAPNPQLPAP